MKNTLSVVKNIEEHLLDLRKGKENAAPVRQGLLIEDINSYTARMPPPVRQSLLTEDMTHTSVSKNCTYADWKTIPISAASGYVGAGRN
ncbi:uncharacterized protein DS421_17g589030 [Arachis hypogaea]|nr:uncharacterized protein DS421_17g589030 [Arachis hypogaea]